MIIDLNDAGPQILPDAVIQTFPDTPRKSRAQKYDLDAIRAKLAADTSWFMSLFPNARILHGGREARMANIEGDKSTGEGSCVFNFYGPHAGHATDFGSDNKRIGPIDLIGIATGLQGSELYAEAARIAGMGNAAVAPKKNGAQSPSDANRKAASDKLKVDFILSGCSPLSGSVGAHYLSTRELADPESPDLLFHADLTDTKTKRGWPALVARIRDGKGWLTGGIHRTYLLDDGSGRAPTDKQMMASVSGSVHLMPVGEAGVLGVAEGIETALSAAAIFNVPCWAALSAGGMERWQWPNDLKKVAIFADAGDAGKKAALKLEERLRAAGVDCRIFLPLHGDDFNDDLMRGAVMADYSPAQMAVQMQSIPKNRLEYEDFWTYLPDHLFIHVHDGKLWPGKSVNSQLPPKWNGPLQIQAATWLAKHRAVEQMTWMPGEEQIVQDKLIIEGGWIDRPGAIVFNSYRPPRIEPGDPKRAGSWIDHVHQIYPDEAAHIIAWLAHRVQRPGEKINHSLVLGGAPGIGKDTILEAVKYAIGPWNCAEVSPKHLMGEFNGYIKSVMLCVSEASDLGDVDRYKFYEHCKTLMASPPNTLPCNEKRIRAYHVPNVTSVVITTNHLTDGLYLPADDRRHFVAWSETRTDFFAAKYWVDFYSWYHIEGFRHVAAYLASLDLSKFDPKASPFKTPAFWAIADANRPSENDDLKDAIELLGNPDAVTLDRIINLCDAGLAEWLRDRKNRRKIPHRMEGAEYVPIRNSTETEGRWKIQGKYQIVYARKELTVRERFAAAERIMEERNS